MLHIVVGIVGFVWIPDSGKEVPLPGNRATLDMNAIDEAVLDVGSAPVTAPNQPAALRELSQKREITLPAGLAAHQPDDVARQAVVMNAHGSKFGSSVIKKRKLAVLAAVGFVDHDFNSRLLAGGDKLFH